MQSTNESATTSCDSGTTRPARSICTTARFENCIEESCIGNCHTVPCDVTLCGVPVCQALQCCVNILRSLVEWYTNTQTAASLAAAALVVAASPGVDVVGDDAASDTTAGGETKIACLVLMVSTLRPESLTAAEMCWRITHSKHCCLAGLGRGVRITSA